MKRMQKILVCVALLLNHPVKMGKALAVRAYMKCRQQAYMDRAARLNETSGEMTLHQVMDGSAKAAAYFWLMLTPAIVRMFDIKPERMLWAWSQGILVYASYAFLLFFAFGMMMVMPFVVLCSVPNTDEACVSSLKLARNLFIVAQVGYPLTSMMVAWTPWGVKTADTVVTALAAVGFLCCAAAGLLLWSVQGVLKAILMRKTFRPVKSDSKA